MLPASNRGAGMNIGFPDVCLTPSGPAVTPVPYPNIAMNAMASSFSPNVLLTMMPALNMGSVIPMTSGDEAGVAHPTIKGASTFTGGNPKVMINGLPAIDLTSPSTGNNMNDGAGLQAVPSATNVFYTFAAGAEIRGLEAALPRDGSAVSSATIAGPIGYLRIGFFSADVPARVAVAMRRFEVEGVRGLVVDVRANPGGEARAAIELAADFLPAGSVVVIKRDDVGDETTYRAHGAHPCGLPLIVLVDGGTASAAEIFAGSLQAHRRARLVGSPTHGKHAGIALARTSRGALGVVAASFLLPGGASIGDGGLRPDVELLATEDAIANAAELLQDVR